MPPRNSLPRWRGFNLLEMYSAKSAEPFRDDDFRWMAGWGFDFVRLPLSYTHWIVDGDPGRIDAGGPGLARLDAAVELGQRHGLHVSLNLHRAPGYCVNQERQEPFDLWRDAAALDAFRLHWQTLAQRYRGISSRQLSFDLLNEPPPTRSRIMGRLTGGLTRPRHAAVMRAVIASIRQIDRDRLIILDGLDYGRVPSPDLGDLPNVAQSCRAYEPFELSHYRAPWVASSSRWRDPEWPLRDSRGRRWNRARLEAIYAPWVALMAQGVGVHCGEAGCFQRTGHAVFLAWLREVLAVLGGHGIGWALWNFRGPFGVLDSGRADASYQAWQGHQLDVALLKILQDS